MRNTYRLSFSQEGLLQSRVKAEGLLLDSNPLQTLPGHRVVCVYIYTHVHAGGYMYIYIHTYIYIYVMTHCTASQLCMRLSASQAPLGHPKS